MHIPETSFKKEFKTPIFTGFKYRDEETQSPKQFSVTIVNTAVQSQPLRRLGLDEVSETQSYTHGSGEIRVSRNVSIYRW